MQDILPSRYGEAERRRQGGAAALVLNLLAVTDAETPDVVLTGGSPV